MLQIDWSDYTGVSTADAAAALSQVMEAALPRMSSITFAEPTQQPGRSIVPDPDLAALFPTTIGGQPVTASTRIRPATCSSTSRPDPKAQAAVQQITDQLSAQGKTVDDMSFGSGQVTLGDKSATIPAFRVKGGDAAQFVDAALALTASGQADPRSSTTQVAGRDVTVTQDGDAGAKSYIFPSGEVLWFVTADEPTLSEIIGAIH